MHIGMRLRLKPRMVGTTGLESTGMAGPGHGCQGPIPLRSVMCKAVVPRGEISNALPRSLVSGSRNNSGPPMQGGLSSSVVSSLR